VALNISFVAIPVAILVATQAPSSFPGASPFWVAVIAGVLTVFPVLLYGMFSRVMPRSGGDYVFMSRTLHPWVGFAANFNITVWFVLAMTYIAYLISQLGFSAVFATIGAITGNKTFFNMAADVTSKGWSYAIGAIALIGVTALMSLRLRRALAVHIALFAFSLVGVVIAFILLLLHGRSDFVSAVARAGGSYNGIIAAARETGFAGSDHFDLGNTLLATPLAFLAFGYAIVTAYASGEVRSAKSTVQRTMMLSLVIAVVIVAVLMGLASRTFGNDFMGSATVLSNAGDKGYTLAGPSFLFYFVSLLSNSTLLTVIIGASFICALLVVLPPTFLIATRNLFAWSFDRLIPDKVSEVNERTHSPLVANGIVLLLSLVYLALIVFAGGNFLALLYTSGLAELLTFMTVAIAGVVFAYRRRDLYEESAVRGSVMGVPKLTLVGVAAFAVYLFFFISNATTDALGANARVGVITTIVVAIAGILAFPVAYVVNRRRGVDLGLAFRELPPE
jgi:amino acid transporter